MPSEHPLETARIFVFMTLRRSASLVVHGEVKPGPIHAAPKAPLQGGGEVSADGPECFTE